MQSDARVGAYISVGLALEDLQQSQAAEVDVFGMLIKFADDSDALTKCLFPRSSLAAHQAIVDQRDVFINVFVARGEACTLGSAVNRELT